MFIGLRTVVGVFLVVTPVFGAEPTEEMRTLARMFTTLEARDLTGFCTATHAKPYAEYLTRVCQLAVQHKLKQPEDCSPDRIAQEVKTDMAQCLAMPAAEFEKMVLRGRDGSATVFKDLAAQGIDVPKLLDEARGWSSTK